MRTSSQESEQQREIEQARALLRPSEVRQNHVPNWLRLRLLRTFGCPRGGLTDGWSVLHHAAGWCASWLDHHGCTTIGGREAYVSEPYGLTPRQLDDFRRFADRAGLRWEVSPNSWWYPGTTARLILWAPDDEASDTGPDAGASSRDLAGPSGVTPQAAESVAGSSCQAAALFTKRKD